MKRETLRHPKTYDLAARLQCSRPTALGYLTLLWDHTADHATDGAIGRWANGAIARACDWEGDPDVFVRCLVEAGWLDEDPTHRLLVHDWQVHCERWVKLKLGKLKQSFAVATVGDSVEASTECSTEASTEGSAYVTYPTQPNPNQTKPETSTAVEEGSGRKSKRVAYSEEFLKWWQYYPRKVDKQDAFKAYQTAAAIHGHDALLSAVIAFSQSDVAKREKRLIKHPATWLNKGSFEDDPGEWEEGNDNGETVARPLTDKEIEQYGR